jgi:hypothetical protein
MRGGESVRVAVEEGKEDEGVVGDVVVDLDVEGDGGHDGEVRDAQGWVGFDDEVVVVLKDRCGERGSALMVYDFT